MNIVKKVKEIKIDNKEYLMTFDMTSVVKYSELSGNSFVRDSHKLFNYDDKVIIDFIGSTLRSKEDPKNPIGKNVYDMDVLGLLLNVSSDVVTLVSDSLPNVTRKK